MFANIGNKIKSLSMTLFWVQVVLYIIIALAICVESAIFGLMVLAVGVLVAYLSVLFLYAFGELVDSNQKILAHLNGNSQGANHPVTITQSDRLAKLEQQYSRGIISQEEYLRQKSQLTGKM